MSLKPEALDALRAFDKAAQDYAFKGSFDYDRRQAAIDTYNSTRAKLCNLLARLP